MSLFGPNGQPVTDEKQTVKIVCGGCELVVFKDPRVSVPIQISPGKETEVFLEVIKKVNAYNVYVNAIVRECGALQERVAELEEAKAKAEAPPPLFPGTP